VNRSERTADGIVYEVTGAGPPVLLMHAGIADRTMWDPQWERWADRYTLIRYDHRGLGESANPAEGFSIHGDALAVLDAAGVERAAVIGASIGGRGAIDLALSEPERVDALVTIGSTPSGWQHDSQLLARFAEFEATYEREGLGPINELELQLWIDGPRDPSLVDRGFRSKVAAMNAAVLEREQAIENAGGEMAPAELDPPAGSRLGELALPVLAVTGALDVPSVNAGSAFLVAGVTGAEAAAIPDSTHLPSLERPDRFEAAVLPFLTRLAQT